MPECATRTSRDRPGRWVAEASWPSAAHASRACSTSTRGRLGAPGRPRVLEISLAPDHGGAAGGWLNASPRDQREDDADSLCFDAEPFGERTEISARPSPLVGVVRPPAAFVAARLCDVAPDGSSTRVTYGLWNLTHAPDHASWAPLVPGRRIESRVSA
jgi:predicted acyl esterase